MTTELRKIPVVFFGSGGIGKSSLITKVFQPETYGKLSQNMEPTIVDEYTEKLEVDGEFVILEIIDTSGQYEYEPLIPEQVGNSLTFVVGYSVTERGTDLDHWIDYILQIHANRLKSILVIIVEYKIDLEKEGKRLLPKNESKKYLVNLRLHGVTCEMIRVSVKENINVKYVFERVVQLRRELDEKLKSESKETPKLKENDKFTFKNIFKLFDRPVKKKSESKDETFTPLTRDFSRRYGMSTMVTKRVNSRSMTSIFEMNSFIYGKSVGPIPLVTPQRSLSYDYKEILETKLRKQFSKDE